VFGKVWRQACPLGDKVGGEAPELLLEIAKDKLAKMDARLD
jgi:hypothetical protein